MEASRVSVKLEGVGGPPLGLRGWAGAGSARSPDLKYLHSDFPRGVSGAYPSLLRKRSLAKLLYRVSGEEWRGHNLRALLGALSMVLRQQGFHREADEVASYVKAERRLLSELEEAHVRVVYGVFEYSRKQAETLVNAAKSIVVMLRKVEGGVVE